MHESWRSALVRMRKAIVPKSGHIKLSQNPGSVTIASHTLGVYRQRGGILPLNAQTRWIARARDKKASRRVKSAAERVRLIATDLDGTLLRDDRSISARTQRTLARAASDGVSLVLVTARPPRFVCALASHLGLSGVAICCNGALVIDVVSGDILEQYPIAADDAMALVTGLRDALPGMTFAVERGLEYGCEPAYAALSELPQNTEHLQADALTLCAQPVAKLIARHPAHLAEDVYPLAQRIVGERAAVTYSSPRYLEMSAPGVNKGATLARRCERIGVAPSEVVAFGDMPNDAQMLRWAGRGIAVANAHPEAQAAADDLTASNMEDGVALALERLLDL